MTIVARDCSRDLAAADAQWAVDVVENWSKDWKLNLNASKSEVAFFFTWTHEANHIPNVSTSGTPIPFKPTLKLLGVHFDRILYFEPRTKELAHAASCKLGMIASVRNSNGAGTRSTFANYTSPSCAAKWTTAAQAGIPGFPTTASTCLNAHKTSDPRLHWSVA